MMKIDREEALLEAASKAVEAVFSGNATATETIAVQAIVNCIPLDPSVLDPELNLRLKRSGL